MDRRFSKKTGARWKQAEDPAAHRLRRKGKGRWTRIFFESTSDQEDEKEPDKESVKEADWDAATSQGRRSSSRLASADSSRSPYNQSLDGRPGQMFINIQTLALDLAVPPGD